MNIVLQIVFLEVNLKEIIAIKCPNCGDWYKYYPEGLEEDIEFLGIKTDCWKCGKEYAPCFTAIIIDEFVFDAFVRCKMKH